MSIREGSYYGGFNRDLLRDYEPLCGPSFEVLLGSNPIWAEVGGRGHRQDIGRIVHQGHTLPVWIQGLLSLRLYNNYSYFLLVHFKFLHTIGINIQTHLNYYDFRPLFSASSHAELILSDFMASASSSFSIRNCFAEFCTGENFHSFSGWVFLLLSDRFRSKIGPTKWSDL